MPLSFPHTTDRDQARRDAELQRADAENLKRGQDLELQPSVRLILHSPNGNRWSLTVDNVGVLSATAL
jgi:hypothetical protein